MVLKFKFALCFGIAFLLLSCADAERDGANDPRNSVQAQDVGMVKLCGNSVTGANTVACGGQTYKTVQIGSQIWMAENMNYDGGNGKLGYEPWYNKDYARLYDWATAMGFDQDCNYSNDNCSSQIHSPYHRGICPEGWHIPTSDEWDTLFDFAEEEDCDGTSSDGYGGYCRTAGWHLKATYGWSINNSNGKDTYGFSALPNGYCYNYGKSSSYPSCQQGSAYWWSASKFHASLIDARSISYNNNATWDGMDKMNLLSVRCLKDDFSNSSSSNICGGQSFTPPDKRCSNNIIETKCGSHGWYNASDTNLRCENGVVETKCGSIWYDTTNTNLRCQYGYNLQELCGDWYNVADNLRCMSGNIEYRCNATDPNSWYVPGNYYCLNNIIVTKCGSEWYNASNTNERCNNNTYVEKMCGTNGWYRASDTNLDCQRGVIVTKCGTDGWYDTTNVNLSCQNNVIITKCGESLYDASNENLVCNNNVLQTKCGATWQNASAQLCYNNSQMVDKCGINPQAYNPSLYECKPDVNPNGIFLKNPVDYQDEDYEAVLIGEQIWMARNLNYDVPDNTTDVCYNNSSSEPNYCESYGRLYDWATAMTLNSNCNSVTCASQVNPPHRGICPDGWHIPSDAEWTTLTNYVEIQSACTNCAGTRLKATSGWNGSGDGTDDYGFSALPGSYRNSMGTFYDVGSRWWSANEYDSNNAYYRSMAYNLSNVSRSSSSKSFFLYSVRCVQD